MKRISTIVLAICACLSLAGCDEFKKALGSVLSSLAEETAEEVVMGDGGLLVNLPADVVVEGNTLRYGSHTYTVSGVIDYTDGQFKTPTATVTFTNVPSDFAEFSAVYENLLGKSTHGTAAMVPMAIELYARDAELGERCLNLLCNGPATVSQITGILKQKFVPSSFSPENDSYIQRYLPAALLKGAVPSNAYTPVKPYTVEMCPSPNGVKAAPLTGGEVTYLYILAGGWDTFQRAVDIFLKDGDDHYKVFNCPSCYTQCKQIRGTWPGLE
ncbi:MAG: hypothetical protein K6G79_02315 [Bacteroidales bacterium]|nr:hypothetical protein [Bacteroidales bacterium]